MTVTVDPAAAPRVVKEWLERTVPRIDAELDRRLAMPARDPGRLVEAMRYAVLGPGKRLRPAIVLEAAEAAGGPGGRGVAARAEPERLEAGVTPAPADLRRPIAAACALEMLHAYTLVHDDLPAMDDDDERRGRPTVHIAFGEATAILAGDGLLTAAFEALAEVGPDAVRVLAQRAGAAELLRGQAIDLDGFAPRTIEEVEELHAGKTGALFAAAAELGGIAAGADADARARLATWGMAIGIAFQHADDRDDGDFPALAAAASERIRFWCSEAAAAVQPFGERGAVLEAIARWIGARA